MGAHTSSENAQPGWHQSLPPHVQFSSAPLVNELERLRNELKLDDQTFMMFLVQSKTVMLRNLVDGYLEARRAWPGRSDRVYFAMVMDARLKKKIEVHHANTSATAVSREELQGMLDDLKKIVDCFSSLDDVIGFFVDLENREKRFADEAGYIARIDACCSRHDLS